eukprot:9322778-Pyramimonas_sp.AAC.1
MAIPAMATITQVDGPAGQNSGSVKIVLRPPSGPSRVGNPEKFVDDSCKVIRYTEKGDMITDEGRRLALNDRKTFKGKRITLWGSMP